MINRAPPISVAEGAYRRIRGDIIFGRLSPGSKLKLDMLKDRYGASVSTLREILNRLASDGFVIAEGQRGFEVAPVSAENLKEISELRKLLEILRSGAFVQSRRHGLGRTGRSRSSQAPTDGAGNDGG